MGAAKRARQEARLWVQEVMELQRNKEGEEGREETLKQTEALKYN